MFFYHSGSAISSVQGHQKSISFMWTSLDAKSQKISIKSNVIYAHFESIKLYDGNIEEIEI